MNLLDRVAAAPISWGICEAPGWGRELPPERVLGDMRALGLRATELGPAGFLPPEPAALAAALDRYGLRLVAGFVPAVLHQAEHLDETLAGVAAEAARLRTAGADVLVLAAVTGTDTGTDGSATDAGGSGPGGTGGDGYEQRPVLDEPGWAQLVTTLDRLSQLVPPTGIDLALHPHVGTLIEGPAEVERLLATTAIDLCVDTGHLAIGGTDPVDLVERCPERVRHVHLKDVDLDRAEALRQGRLGYIDAVRQGLYRPLGRGDVDIRRVVTSLERAGYQHWYVIEQDVSLPSGNAADEAVDPAADVRISLEFVREVERQLGTATHPHANVTTARAPR
jgi:inosose dehydratase